MKSKMFIYLLGRKVKLHDSYREVTQENVRSECDKNHEVPQTRLKAFKLPRVGHVLMVDETHRGQLQTFLCGRTPSYMPNTSGYSVIAANFKTPR